MPEKSILTEEEEAKAREMGRIMAEEVRKDPKEEALRDMARKVSAEAKKKNPRYIMTNEGLKREE